MTDNDSKIPFTKILCGVTSEKFAEILGASSRKARETYFHRHGVRAAGKSGFAKPGAKNEARVAKLFEVLRDETDDEMAEEILRSWLLTKRPLLAAALDHLGIEHDNGLTESEEISKFEKLSRRDIAKLLEVLGGHGSREDAIVYLEFMGVKEIDKAAS